MSDYWPERTDFGPLFSKPAARATDPKTSHDAAKRVAVAAGRHRAAILEALGLGPAGQTEIAQRTGMTVAAVSKRLCDLRRDGAIERAGETVSGTGGREAMYRLCAARDNTHPVPAKTLPR